MKVANALRVEPTNRWIRHSAVVLKRNRVLDPGRPPLITPASTIRKAGHFPLPVPTFFNAASICFGIRLTKAAPTSHLPD